MYVAVKNEQPKVKGQLDFWYLFMASVSLS